MADNTFITSSVQNLALPVFLFKYISFNMCVKVIQSHLTLFDPMEPTRLLCPRDSPGRNTGVGYHALLQGFFLTQGLNPGLLHCRQILYYLSHHGGVLSFPAGSDGEESACSAGDPGLTPGLERSPDKGQGNQLQYSCLENPMDRGAWLFLHGGYSP